LLDGTPVLDLKPYVPLFDSIDTERIGWLTHKAETVHTVRADRRFQPSEEGLVCILEDATPSDRAKRVPSRRPSVRDVMYANPKTLPHDATVGDVRQLFENPRVNLALLVHRGACTGTITRADITAGARDEDAAGWFAQPPQTIHVTDSLAEAHHQLSQTPNRRLVVIDDRNQLQGLLCHNRAGNGFCNSTSPCSHRGGTQAKKTRWRVIHTSASAEEQATGLLVAKQGKSIYLGDLLTLPPATRTHWLVVDVRDDPRDNDSGVVTVEALRGE
jgi:CBS domain-containing protein